MNRQTDGSLANYRWWMGRRTLGIVHNGCRVTFARFHFLTAPQSLSNKKARQTAVMHRRLHMLLVQHGARPAPWKTETLHACGPCAIFQRRAGEPTKKRPVTARNAYYPLRGRQGSEQRQTRPHIQAPLIERQSLRLQKCAAPEKLRNSTNLYDNCTKLVTKKAKQ